MVLPRSPQTVLVVFVIIISFLVNPGLAIAGELNLEWHGDGGYEVGAKVVYPDLEPGIMVKVAGMQEPQNLTMLRVQVRNSNGKPLASYENVSNGHRGVNDFLQFHFDPDKKQLRGWLDIGGVGKNDYFLKGQPGSGLDLFHLDSEGKESKVDHNNGDFDFLFLSGS
jgi:hypothetical protein